METTSLAMASVVYVAGYALAIVVLAYHDWLSVRLGVLPSDVALYAVAALFWPALLPLHLLIRAFGTGVARLVSLGVQLRDFRDLRKEDR